MTDEQIQEFWQRSSAHTNERVLRELEMLPFEDLLRVGDWDYSLIWPHVLPRLNRIPLEGKQVLEIGIGDGACSEQLIRRGAIWSGVDPSEASIQRVTRRLCARRLPYQAMNHGGPAELPYEREAFDVVFSCCFLSRLPDLDCVQHEIARVLKPQGELIAILYARWSLHRFFSCAAHMLANTPLPTGFVYDTRKLRRVFRDFRLMRASKMLLDAPYIPESLFRSLPGSGLLGSWVWAHLQVRS